MFYLLHRHALGQIAGLIDVTAAQDGHIVGEQLQRHDELQGHQQLVIVVQTYHIVRHALRDDNVLRREEDDPRTAALGLLGVGDGLFVHLLLGGQRDDRHTVGDEADGTVLELTGSVGVRVDVADLLELQAAFQREGVVEAAPDEEAALGVDEAADEAG